MKKIILTMGFNAIIYVVPLAFAPGVILNYKVLVCFVAATVLFMSQPVMSLREAKEKRSMDRNSIFAILIAAMVGQMVSVGEWAYVIGEPYTVHNWSFAGVGLALMIVGIAFRLWSIKTLGGFFTSTVQIKDEHRVVKIGPYKVVRHPSYLGSLVAIIGSSIFMETPVGALVSMVTMVIAYKLRIDAEESALVNALGDAYREYQQKTRRLIPCVW